MSKLLFPLIVLTASLHTASSVEASTVIQRDVGLSMVDLVPTGISFRIDNPNFQLAATVVEVIFEDITPVDMVWILPQLEARPSDGVQPRCHGPPTTRHVT